MWSLRANLALATSALVLSLASVVVVLQGAADEPYLDFRGTDAVVQVGVAMVLIAVVGAVGRGAITIGVARRRISRWWTLVLLWGVICEFYLYFCPSGYISDIARYVAHPQ